MNQPVCILVVDDDPDILSGTARLLGKAGYAVDRASSGEEALQAAYDHHPDLLLLDHDLPGIDGTEVCRRIKRDPALADSLVVIVSASHAESDQQAEGLESGADGYIGRPIANRELLARVAAYVRILRLARSLRLEAAELQKSSETVNQAQLASLNLMEDAVAVADRLATANQELRGEITARKRAEAEKETLEAQNRQLHKSESLGRMAGAIAHHFNNKLQAVMGNLELALMDLPQNGGPFETVTQAMQAARQATEVSRIMLTYLGLTVARCDPLDLAEVCHGQLPMLRAGAPQIVVLVNDLPSPGPTINANGNQIRQVLTNLVTNAWESTGNAGGVIRLTVKNVSATEVPATHRYPIDWQPHDPAYGCLEVVDTGCGIPAQDLEKIFDPFFSSKFTGRGMGLSVVLGIVRAHNGVVTVESEPGRGSVFRVFLPLSAEAIACLKPSSRSL